MIEKGIVAKEFIDKHDIIMNRTTEMLFKQDMNCIHNKGTQ